MGSNELEFFKRQMESCIKKASLGIVTLTSFLDETKQVMLQVLAKRDVEVCFDGGFKNAEYKRAICKPVDYTGYIYKIKVYEILYQKRFLELTHRKVLGSLMSLGIKRESIGDIVLLKDKVYFACTEEISSYIIASFKTIQGVPIELLETKDRLEVHKEIKEEVHIVSSMRLDVILASAYHLSRNEATQMILDGSVNLNHIVCLNTSKMVDESDIISVRHKGRIYVGTIGGKTRSGRINVKLGFLV
ncbi:MAG: hypothetical protein K2N64_04600 [Anaeroplasmataceae bacterium]|nr:hypothetical protein [Anaeroplasmataceae bacterium]